MITSRHNPRVKRAASLRDRKHRDALGRTLVYGPRETQRALHAGVPVEQVFVCHDLLRTVEARGTPPAAAGLGAEVIEVSAEVFELLAYGDRLDGVVAVAATCTRALADLALPEQPLIAVVEGVEKPGNLGAILRTADGAGVDAVVAADPVIDLFNPNVIRASVGAVFKPNVAVAPADETLAWLAGLGVPEQRFPVYAARPNAKIDCFAADFTKGGAIVLGNEASGLTELWSGDATTAVSLPMHGIADSLNVSATAAAVFYEALRQRRG